jgi:hypothetical protein
LSAQAGTYGADNAENRVASFGNVLAGNGTSIVLRGGSHAASRSGGNDNRLWFTSHGDTIASSATGVFVVGADRSNPAFGRSSGNRVRVELLGTTFAANARDLSVTGAQGLGPVTDPGEDNVVSILVRNATSDSTSADAFLVVDYTPASAPASNQVTVVGSSMAFTRTNTLDNPED